MSILQYASPTLSYYERDQDIIDNYDARIKSYNAEFEKYKSAAEKYQKQVDAHNALVNMYNEGRLRDVPVFRGVEPVAPKDPGFTGKNVEDFVKAAQGRAQRRADAAATTRAVMTTPGQYYIAGGENFGSNPTASLAGMSGFGATAMGFAEGGVAGLFQQYAEGGAVSGIPDDALTAMREKVINDYGFDPVDIAMEEGVDPELFLRVMWTENKGRQGPVSEAGAIGLMQLMPATARELGVDPTDPVQNARGGARYLREQLDTFQSVPLALAAYNAGPGNVRKYGGVPPFEETRNYVALIQNVPTGEILPSMNEFYTRVPGEDPSRRPQMRPEGLGTPGYVPPEPPTSEYLLSGVGSVFGAPQEAPRRPAIPNIMQQPAAPEPEEEARGIEFYRQYAAFQPPEDQANQPLTSSPRI